MEVTDVRGVAAPAEVVYNTLTDLHRAARWLPPGVSAEPLSADRLLVRVGGTVREAQLDRQPGDLAVTWWLVDLPAWSGAARVREEHGGASTVEVRVLAPDVDAAHAERARSLLAESLRQFERDVADNFTTG
jgi:uncharacterized protein YndB with AHSA1/START domain